MAMENYRHFLFFLITSILIGFLSILFVLIWVFQWREGLAWDGGLAEFNWHPVLTVTGFIFIQGIAIVVYRLPWTWKCSKLMMKFIHAGLHTVAFVLAVISLVAVFDFHNYKSIPNMYSLHSWIGLMGVVLYTLQLVLGLCIYLFPMTPAFIRAAFMPIHVYSGLLIFGTVIATALMGITEKLFFALKNPAYKDSPPEAVFINTLGLLIVVFGGTVIWMVTRPSWKRPSEEASTFKQDGKVSSVTENELNLNSFDKATMESSSEAWKRNLKLEEAGLRSTM
ncbi:cytochrome b reductase 1 [Acipenser oxyrinchus oxyrinchus]|uniref:Plasma membrane ascorbate-dependent reductase CYBRD1 n=1 Tax=Acipenser oxyrinchus oxyrinchus TaxID=40147 RepID=A0AAD8G6D5_ACIOX|nr:cytochrome b reductase 1 [Acipenser oxyrinchus oxyrinchus]